MPSSLPGIWPEPVAVTGLGCVSPLGMDLEENLLSLQKGHDAAAPVTLFSTKNCRCQKAAQLPDPDVSQADKISPRAKYWHRSTRMLLAATHEACSTAKLNQKSLPSRWIVGSTSGGMSAGEDFSRFTLKSPPSHKNRRTVQAYLPQTPLHLVANHFGWDCETILISNACASGGNAIGHAARLIALGQENLIVCGGYDTLSQLVFAGFDCLQASSPDSCRPFDQNRSGLMLGEGAAVLVLEKMTHALDRKAPILGTINGYGAVNDNHHLTQPDPGGLGSIASMQHALHSANWTASSIDYINAHGTGTPLNDASE
ncbi:MAG: beta-ketoacyl-[acyl-carrier-protein] synthase family protein, partial [Chthoniobacterales bacterium]